MIIEHVPMKKDFLVQYNNGEILYCRKACALKAGFYNPNKGNGRFIEESEYNQREHGALCPVCEREYWSF